MILITISGLLVQKQKLLFEKMGKICVNDVNDRKNYTGSMWCWSAPMFETLDCSVDKGRGTRVTTNEIYNRKKQDYTYN